MIHDAKVEVTCDGDCCNELIFINLDFVYGGIAHTFGYYDHAADKVERKLRKANWTANGGKHLCESCTQETK